MKLTVKVFSSFTELITGLIWKIALYNLVLDLEFVEFSEILCYTSHYYRLQIADKNEIVS